MEIQKTAVLKKDDIDNAIRDYLRKNGYELYIGTMDYIYETDDENIKLKQVECLVFEEISEVTDLK